MNHDELIRNDCHPWCRCTARDEAVRAAEDGRQGPFLTLGEAIAAFCADDPAKRSPKVSETSGRQSGMRTERITLEVTQRAVSYAPVRDLNWDRMLRATPGGLFPGESVRVVEAAAPAGHRGSGVFDANGDEVPWEGVVAALKDERDAAIHERDAANERRILVADELRRLRARVAELDAASVAAGIEITEGDCLSTVRDRGRRPMPKGPPPGLVTPPTTKAASGAANSSAEPKSSEPVALSISPAERDGLQAIDDGLRRHGNGFVVIPGSDSYRAVRSILDRHTTSPPPACGWLTEKERRLIESLEGTFQQKADALRSQGLHGHVDNWERKVKLFRSLLARLSPPEANG